MHPVALSCFAVYALMSTGLTFNKEAAVLVRREGWLGAFLNFEPNIIGVLLYVLVGVFSPADVYVEPVTQYNPVLWTHRASRVCRCRGRTVSYGVVSPASR